MSVDREFVNRFRLLYHHRASGIKFLRHRFSEMDMRSYVMTAISCRGEDDLRNILLKYNLERFDYIKQLQQCDLKHPSRYFRLSSNKEHDLCEANARSLHEAANRSLLLELNENKYHFLREAWKLIAQPTMGFSKLTRKDHERVLFYFDLLEAQKTGMTELYLSLVILKIPEVSLLGVIDLDRAQTYLLQLSSSELLIISSFLKSLLLQKPSKLSLFKKFLVNDILRDLSYVQRQVLRPSREVFEKTVKKIHVIAKNYQLAEPLLECLMHISDPEYMIQLQAFRRTLQFGGKRFRWRFAGWVILLFFLSILSGVVALVVNPIQTLINGIKYSVDIEDDGSNYLESLNIMYSQMVNDNLKAYQWLPDQVIGLIGYKTPIDVKIVMKPDDIPDSLKLKIDE